MAIDPNVFQNLHTFADYQRADQDFQLKKQLAMQSLQSGGIDAQSKANIYKTQVLSSSVAGGQQSYDMARSSLQEHGIDTSDMASDVATASKQLEAARLAQSPLGTLFTAQQKIIGNNIAGTAAMGNTNNPFMQPVPTISPTGAISLNPVMPSIPQTRPTPKGTPVEHAQIMGELYPDAAPETNVMPNAIPQPIQSSQPAKFSPPAQEAGETNQAYNQRVQTAFEAYKADPALLASNKKTEAAAGKEGEHLGEAAKTYDIMQSNLPFVLKRFQEMRDASINASSGFGVDSEGDGWAQKLQNSSLGNPKVADANGLLKQRSAQGILPELGPQLAQAGIRGNKFLETLATSASGLDLSAPAQTKTKLIDGLENTYVSNLKSTAAQLRANGQPSASDAEIDALVGKYKSVKSAAMPTITTQAQRDALPSGTPYIGRDGNQYQKK